MEPLSFPAGGVAVIYRHAEILSDHGIPAFVALPSKPAVDFYDTHAPLIVHGGKLDPQPGDVWVIPEGWREYMEALKSAPVKRIVFCQNQYYVAFTENPYAGFSEFDVDGVIASSESVRSFFQDVYELPRIPLIPCAIDPAIYFPSPAKRRQIAYMPRKLPEDAAFIYNAFRRRHRRYADLPWVAIGGTTQREAAAIMAASEVFLSLSHKESFGLPPLEAMACGCLVAGFHGDGGREYMTSENGWWAETGDWKACVDGLAEALDLLNCGGPALAARRESMAATVRHYSPERMEAELLGYWQGLLSTPF